MNLKRRYILILIVIIIAGSIGAYYFSTQSYSNKYYSFESLNGWDVIEGSADASTDNRVYIYNNLVDDPESATITIKVHDSSTMDKEWINNEINVVYASILSKDSNNETFNSPDPNFKVLENRSVRVDTVKAMYIVMENSNQNATFDNEGNLNSNLEIIGKQKIIWVAFNKDNRIYEIIYEATPASFETYKKDFDSLLSTFDTKE